MTDFQHPMDLEGNGVSWRTAAVIIAIGFLLVILGDLYLLYRKESREHGTSPSEFARKLWLVVYDFGAIIYAAIVIVLAIIGTYLLYWPYTIIQEKVVTFLAKMKDKQSSKP